MGWSGQHLRHAAELVRQGRNPAARVYESIGSGFFLAPAPGWLNLRLWDGPGSPDEAEDACRRLVTTLASALPAGGVVVDVGNGLGTQDPLIAQAARPRAARRGEHHGVAADNGPGPAAGGGGRAGGGGCGPAAVRRRDGRRDHQRGGGFPFPLPEGLLRRVSPGAPARWRAEHLGHRDPAMAGHVARAALGPDAVAGLRAAAHHGDDGRADRRGRARGRPHRGGGHGMRRPGHRPRAPAHRRAAERRTAAPAGQHAAAWLLLRQVDLLWRRRIIDYLLLRAIRPRGTGGNGSPETESGC